MNEEKLRADICRRHRLPADHAPRLVGTTPEALEADAAAKAAIRMMFGIEPEQSAPEPSESEPVEPSDQSSAPDQTDSSVDRDPLDSANQSIGEHLLRPSALDQALAETISRQPQQPDPLAADRAMAKAKRQRNAAIVDLIHPGTGVEE